MFMEPYTAREFTCGSVVCRTPPPFNHQYQGSHPSPALCLVARLAVAPHYRQCLRPCFRLAVVGGKRCGEVAVADVRALRCRPKPITTLAPARPHTAPEAAAV